MQFKWVDWTLGYCRVAPPCRQMAGAPQSVDVLQDLRAFAAEGQAHGLGVGEGHRITDTTPIGDRFCLAPGGPPPREWYCIASSVCGARVEGQTESSGTAMNCLFLRPQTERGGVTRHMVTLAHELTRRGHRVRVATSGGEWLTEFPAASLCPRIPLYPSTLPNLLLSVARLRGLVRREKIEILHSHHRFSTVVGRVVARLTGAPLVSTVHEFKADRHWLAPLWLAPSVCVATHALKDHLVRLYGVAPERVTIVRFGQAPTRPDPSATSYLQSVLGAAAGGPVVGFVGRLAPEKDVATLLRALPEVFRACPAACGVLVGEGEERRVLEALAEDLGIAGRVHFLGARPDALRLMKAMDVVAVPSLTENFSLTVAEAMEAGRPVVASAVGGLVEMVEDGVTGFLVPPRSPEALGRRIADVLAKPLRAATMGAAGRQKSAEWSAARAAEITEALYERMLARH